MGYVPVSVDLEPVQLIAPDGTPLTHDHYRADLSEQTLRQLYELMVLTREVDVEMINLQRQGQLALFASCRGQEAAQVGAVASLQDCDWLFPQYRELGVFITRGIPPGDIAAFWRGTWNGGLHFTQHCCAPISVPIGTQALHAVGSAMASQYFHDRSVSVAFVGDGATSEGDVHEALNFAAVFKSPCIFYVQNNQWAISVPVHRQMAAPSIAHKAIGYGMNGIRVDGNDPLACYAVMAEAACQARNGDGPTLIEAITYRIGPHTTSDDPTRYRQSQEVEEWSLLDPLARYKNYLNIMGLWSEQFHQHVQEQANQLRTQLRQAIVDAPDMDIQDVFTTVFTQQTPDLAKQYHQLASGLGRFPV